MKLKENVKVVRNNNGGFLHQLGSLFKFNKSLLQEGTSKFVSNAQRPEKRQDIFDRSVKENKKIKKLANKVVNKIHLNAAAPDLNLNLNVDATDIEKMYRDSKNQILNDDKISKHRAKLMGRNNVLGYLPFFAEKKPAQTVATTVQLAQKPGSVEVLSQPTDSQNTKPGNLMDVFQSQISLAQAELEKVPDLDDIVGKINTSKLSWKAKAYPKYKGLSWREIYSSLGKKNIKHMYHDSPEVLDSEKAQDTISSLAENTQYASHRQKYNYQKFAKKSLEKETDVNKKRASSDKGLDYANLFEVEEEQREPPLAEFFSWKQHMPEPRDQGQCGSCYLMASVAMLEARLSIKYGRTINLSTQYIGDCNVYSQGCGGGYSYQVLRFLREFWTFPERCKRTTNRDGQCTTTLDCDLRIEKPELISVRDYYYVGSIYGNNTEELMMQEIKKNGPIVSSFEPRHDFGLYQVGVYSPEQAL